MRMLVLGAGGSGKSTLARKLSRETNIPVYHLDQLYWTPGWIPVSEEEFQESLEDVLKKETWIVDGNYSSTFLKRVEYATHIVYLKRSTIGNLFRVLKRVITYRGKTRPDMTEGCFEQVDFEFIWWIITFHKKHRKFLSDLKKNHKDILTILHTKKEMDVFLSEMRDELNE